MTFPAKAPAEKKLLSFDFSTEAATGAVLSNPVVSVLKVVSGTGNITDVTIASAFIDGLWVRALTSVGLPGVKYRIRAEADADNGEHHIIDKDLPVTEKGALVD
jgi:hypothetical protein